MKKLYSILICIFLTACADATLAPFPQDDVRPLKVSEFPLAVGNEWRFDVADYDKNTTDQMIMTITSITEKISGDDDSSIPSDTSYTFSQKYIKDNSQSRKGGVMFRKGNKLYASLDLITAQTKSQYIVIAEYPLTPRKEWQQTVYMDKEMQVPIRERRQVIRVFDTTFANETFKQCAEIEVYWQFQRGNASQTEELLVRKYILSPFVGMISEVRYANGVAVEQKSLTKYTLKKEK